jgi:SAM-dependent MidA family methyltransferase
LAHDQLTLEINRSGSVGFDRFMELALYDPTAGFFTAGGGAGRRGDFITSVEVGPLFGAVIARALDRWWDELGRPDPFTVVDVGAGVGTLGRAVMAADSQCRSALRFIMVERSEVLRAEQPQGPGLHSAAEMPSALEDTIVIANELLDNLPTRLLERTREGWAEVCVATGEGGGLAEHLESFEGAPVVALDAGRRVPLQDAARTWLERTLASVDRGRVVVFDYADETASMAKREWTDWLRTYRNHERGGHPLADVGAQDITCEVALDQLRAVRQPSVERTQAEFLAAHDIHGLIEEGRRVWAERASIGDLAAILARSRVTEAEALMDETGLGAFSVLEWAIPEV